MSTVHNQLIFRGRYLSVQALEAVLKVGAPDVTAFHGRLRWNRGAWHLRHHFQLYTQAKAIGQLTGINLIHGKELGELVQRHELLSIKL